MRQLSKFPGNLAGRMCGATAKAKAKALLTSMSGAMNSYVVRSKAARRAEPPIFPTPRTTANTLLADGAASGSGEEMQLHAADAAADAAAGPVAVPQMQLLSYLMPGEAEVSKQEFPVPGEAKAPQLEENDEAAAKCQFCFERLDAAEPWLIWVKLCVGSFVCCF